MSNRLVPAVAPLLIMAIGVHCSGKVSGGGVIPQERKISWHPGIPGGIPARTTIFANVRNPPYTAAGNGIDDDTASLQRAIDDCPANQVVYLPEGTYLITGGLNVTKGIVIRGDGPARTKLNMSPPSGIPSGIFIHGSGFSRYLAAVSGYGKGSTTIVLSDASSVSVGDYLVINQDNDDTTTHVTQSGTGGDCTWCGMTHCSNDADVPCDWDGMCGGGSCNQGGLRTLGQVIKVTGKSGNTLDLEQPLNWDYIARASPKVMKIPSMVEYAGVEDLYVSQSGTNVMRSIYVDRCAFCWLKNVESYLAVHRHVESTFTYRNEYRDSYFHHGDRYDSDHAYGIELWQYSTANLIENNIFNTLLIPMQLVGGPSGNVFAYNYSHHVLIGATEAGTQTQMADFGSHGAHPHMNLFEGNYGRKGSHDNYWGSASHSTWLRNYLGSPEPGYANQINPVTLDADNRFMSLVGNVLGRSDYSYSRYEVENYTGSCYYLVAFIFKLGYQGGSGDCDAAGNDPEVKTTLFRHGNYDYYSKSVVWDPATADHTIPDSYYLTSRPSWWNCRPWPSIGPDVNGYVQSIPAKDRFDGYSCP